MRHVVLVGATDGIGRALARAYVERSWRVGLLGRDGSKVEQVLRELADAVPAAEVVGGVLDVTETERVVPALEKLVVELGQMDLLLYVAGVMEKGSGAVEHMLRVNAMGAMNVLEWGAEYFAAAGGGRLAAIGSVAGDRGRRGNPEYAASKAALHAYLSGLRHRLHASGVGVSTVKPGWVRTRMLGDVGAFPPSIEASRAADLIVRGLEAGRDVVYVPWWWRWVSLALRTMPTAVFKRLAPP